MWVKWDTVSYNVSYSKMLFTLLYSAICYLWVDEEWECWMYHSCRPNRAGKARDGHDRDPTLYLWSLPMGPAQTAEKLDNRTTQPWKSAWKHGSDRSTANILPSWVMTDDVLCFACKAEYPGTVKRLQYTWLKHLETSPEAYWGRWNIMTIADVRKTEATSTFPTTDVFIGYSVWRAAVVANQYALQRRSLSFNKRKETAALHQSLFPQLRLSGILLKGHQTGKENSVSWKHTFPFCN